MAIAALSNSSLLQSMSLSSMVSPSQGTGQLQQQSAVSANSSSSQLASDTYTPSSQSTQTSRSSSTSSASSSAQSKSTVSGVPQSVLAAMAKYGDSVQGAWTKLGQSVASGDLSSSQTALNTYTQTLSASNYSMSSLTAPSAQFLSDLTTLGSALTAGNVADAQSAFATAQKDAPLDVSSAIALAFSDAEADGGLTVQGIEASSSLSGVNYGQLSNDTATLDSTLREGVANISSFLATQGFSASDASSYASAMLNISNGSKADNAQVDTTRTTQWVDALTQYAQKDTTPTWFDGAPTPSNPMDTVLAGVMFASTISSWNQTQALLESTSSASSNGSKNSSSSAGVSLYA